MDLLERFRTATSSTFPNDKEINIDELLIKDTPESLAVLAKKMRQSIPPGKRITFVSGNFNVVHPGHFRLLNFAAECGDFLVVGVNDDLFPGTLVPQRMRVEGVKSISCVDFVVNLTVPPEEFLTYLEPETVVKGNEHELCFNSEQAIIENYGGKLVFCSGEMRFSSMDLLRSELHESLLSTIKKPIDYLQRHSIKRNRLLEIAHQFSDLSIIVIGDLIVDEYITCDPIGISREDPTIVVTPLVREQYVGAAGIVAAHARGLGAKVSYFSVVGNDETGQFAKKTLEEYGVETYLFKDTSRPTTLKQRFRAEGKTLLRVSHLRQHNISHDLTEKIKKKLTKVIKNADLVIFSDFNYGCLPQQLVEEAVNLCKKHAVPMAADSQSSSQIGDISRFPGMLLITPTEHEARLAVHDQGSGLIVLAESLQKKSHAKHVVITLGAEGLLIHSPDATKNQLVSDQLPAFNSAPKDVAGGGDSFLVGTSLALAAGATIWESAYIGSVTAACHVARVGNLPLSRAQIVQELQI